MQKKHLLFTLSALFIFLTGCNIDESPLPSETNTRGRIISAELQDEWSVAQVDSLILSIDPFLFIFIQGRYPVKIYHVIYETVSFDGSYTIASGVACLPYSDSIKSFPLASYQHGTVLHRDGVPSRDGSELQIGVLLGSAGYAGAFADYLGLGDSPGFHPYMHAKSEATAVTDMIRATRDLMKKTNVDWNKQLFLYGYSQGGHATMATHRYIQTNLPGEFTVTASAPMSGPYDVSGEQESVIVSFNSYPTPGYLPFVLYSYNMIYGIAADISVMFRPPYDTLIPPLMNGLYSMGQVNNASPSVPRMMLKDSVMAAYDADANHPLKLALRNNDLWNWVPRTPVRMFYCEGDDQVSYRNTIVTYDKFIAAGASPELVSIYQTDMNADHTQCAQPSFLAAKVWFDSMKKD